MLILILYCGENEYKSLLRSLEHQSYQKFDTYTISNKPNKEAHDELYNKIMASKDDFDIFVKIDADMILEDECFLERIHSSFMNNPELDMLSYTVYDYFTQSKIWGVNSFSKRCNWSVPSEGIFVDYSPKFPGKHLRYIDESLSVSHCKEATEYQSFMFGFHRATKVLQRDRRYPLFGHMVAQLSTMKKVRDLYQSSEGEMQRYALLGLYFFLNENKHVKCIEKPKIFDEFQTVKLIDKKQLLKKTSLLRVLLGVGFARLVFSLVLYLKNK